MDGRGKKMETLLKSLSRLALALCLVLPASGQNVRMGNIPTTNNAAGAYLVGTIGTGSSAPARLIETSTLFTSPTVNNSLTFTGGGSSCLFTNWGGTNLSLWSMNRDVPFWWRVGQSGAGDEGAEIYWNPWHYNVGGVTDGELQIASSGTISINPGYTRYGTDRRVHIGSSGDYRDWTDIQYDHRVSSSDQFGYSKPFRWVTPAWNGTAESVKYPTIQGMGLGTNLWGLRFYHDHTTVLSGTNWDWAAIAPHWSGDMDNLGWNLRGRQLREKTDLTSATNVVIDFAGSPVQFLTAGHTNIALTGTNYPTGTTNAVNVQFYLDSGSVGPSVTFPAWNWFGTSPSNSVGLGTMLKLDLTAIGAGDGNVMASASYGNSLITWDTDATNFLSRAGITDNPTKAAINTFVAGLKADNLWTNFDALYPMVGGTSNSCAQNLISNAYPIAFPASGVTYASTGVRTSGGSGQSPTGFTPSTANGRYQTNSAHLFYYFGDNSLVDMTHVIGAVDDNGTRAYIYRNGGSWSVYGLNRDASTIGVSAAGNFQGPVLASITGSGEMNIYTRLGNASTTAPGTALPVTQINVLCRGYTSNQTLTTNECRGASFGAGLTSDQWTSLTNRWAALQSALSRSAP